jgi:phosphomannomutase
LAENLVISASGIRGIVYDPLSPALCAGLAAAFTGLLGKGTYVVGRDSRPSGQILSMAVGSAIIATGSDAAYIGICPTPTVQLAVEEMKAKGGIAITASHNPAEWNALKLISGDGTFLRGREVRRVVELMESGGTRYAGAGDAGKLSRGHPAGDSHIAKVLELPYVDAQAIRRRSFNVAIDCVSGAGSRLGPDLLKKLGCRVIPIDCDESGDFKRNPEPVAANLSRLCGEVNRSGADVGFALDPDADRLAIVDERGEPLGEDYTLAICADLVLTKAKGPVVTNLSTSMAVADVARKHGVEFQMSPIGEINVVERMRAVGSIIGGEGNGGVILPAVHYGRDSLVGMALVLEAMAEHDGPVSAMMENFPRYCMFKEKVRLGRETDYGLLKGRLEKEFPKAGINLDDGVRLDLEGSWVHVRKSGTEPVLRIIAEAGSREEARGLVDRALACVKSQGGK